MPKVHGPHSIRPWNQPTIFPSAMAWAVRRRSSRSRNVVVQAMVNRRYGYRTWQVVGSLKILNDIVKARHSDDRRNRLNCNSSRRPTSSKKRIVVYPRRRSSVSEIEQSIRDTALCRSIEEIVENVEILKVLIDVNLRGYVPASECTV